MGFCESADRYFLAYGTMSVVLSAPRNFEFGLHRDHVLPTVEVVFWEDARLLYEPIFGEVEAWAAKRTVAVEPAVLAEGDRAAGHDRR